MVGAVSEDGWVKRETPDGIEWCWRSETQPEVAVQWHRIFLVVSTVAFFMVLIPLGVTFLAYRDAANERIADNKAALLRERDLRNRSDWNAYDQCIEGENRDTALVTALTRLIPASSRPQAIIDLIDALEPANELDCPIPKGERPDDLPPAAREP